MVIKVNKKVNIKVKLKIKLSYDTFKTLQEETKATHGKHVFSHKTMGGSLSSAPLVNIGFPMFISDSVTHNKMKQYIFIISHK